MGAYTHDVYIYMYIYIYILYIYIYINTSIRTDEQKHVSKIGHDYW